jgi:flagellar hook assembly protein FlgD
MYLVKELPSVDISNSGLITLTWDGRDADGNIVPDESYFFTVDASDYKGNFALYDPATLSGGESFLPEATHFDKKDGKVSYRLAKDARVRLRAGISQGGPLLKTILNWAPRLSGHNEEDWNGKDESGSIDVVSQKQYEIVAEAVTLPENSIITYGNTTYDYFEYTFKMGSDRPKKEERPLVKNQDNPIEFQTQEPVKIRPEPKFYIEFPESKSENNLPVVTGKIPIKIYLDEKFKRYITEDRYEIIFFVDYNFVTEMEEGYSPFHLMWDTHGLDSGEHIITINVATLSGQVSSNSARVIVRN